MKKNYFAWILCLTMTSSVAITECFLSPKQKAKIRAEWRLRHEDPNAEYVYYSTWFCSTVGSFSIICGTLFSIVGFLAPVLDPVDRIIFGISGPCLIGVGGHLVQQCSRRGPAIVINEEGIRSQNYGLILWQEIAYISYQPTLYSATMHFVLTDGSCIVNDGTILSTTQEKFLAKIARFKKIKASLSWDSTVTLTLS